MRSAADDVDATDWAAHHPDLLTRARAASRIVVEQALIDEIRTLRHALDLATEALQTLQLKFETSQAALAHILNHKAGTK